MDKKKITQQINKIDKIETKLDNFNEQLDNKANELDLEIERKRIDSFTKLEEGSTTGDAELIDGRIGTDGVVYNNIGEAIRGQISGLNKQLEDVITTEEVVVCAKEFDYNTKDGYVTANTVWIVDKIVPSGFSIDNIGINVAESCSVDLLIYEKTSANQYSLRQGKSLTLQVGYNVVNIGLTTTTESYIAVYSTSNKSLTFKIGSNINNGGFISCPTSDKNLITVTNKPSRLNLALEISVFKNTLNLGDLNERINNLENKAYILVSKTGYYKTIQSALDVATDGDVIYVMPGVYEETLNTIGKEINIIGFDKHKCILKNYTGDYNKPPLNCTHGIIKNMTIIADKNTDYVEENKSKINAYGIHLDNYNSTGKNFLCENCIIISYWSSAVGSGLFKDFTAIFKDCDIISHDTIQYNGDGYYMGAMFVHNGANGGNQKLIIDNCNIISDNKYSLRLAEAYANQDITVSIRRTMCFSNETQSDGVKLVNPSEGFLFGGCGKLGNDSYGNNVAILNNF